MMNYDQFLELLRYRRSIRRFKSDPIPDDNVIKILDAAHYAMSGANSQPWMKCRIEYLRRWKNGMKKME